jgi:hypothetical protein
LYCSYCRICADASTERPTANSQYNNLHHHGRCWWKRPTIATQKAPHPAMTRWIDWGRSPKQAGILFSCNERVYDPQNAPIARQDSSPSLPHYRCVLRAIDLLIAGEKDICLLGGLSPIYPTRMQSKLDLVCRAPRGPFPAAAAMVNGGCFPPAGS